jgi:antitoxin component YwqK of YwqJK toxin-antitoxin module
MAGCGEQQPKKPVPPSDGYFYEGDSLNFVRKLYKQKVLVQETTFVNGKAHGTEKNYYKDGTLSSTVEFSEARRNGMSASYYETGEKYMETPYINGKIHGTRLMYMKNGSVSMKAEYINGKPVPPLEEYGADGQKIAQPSIKFQKTEGNLKMELSDRKYRISQFYRIENNDLIEIATKNGAGILPGAVKGVKIRAVYTSPRGAEGAVDAKY